MNTEAFNFRINLMIFLKIYNGIKTRRIISPNIINYNIRLCFLFDLRLLDYITPTSHERHSYKDFYVWSGWQSGILPPPGKKTKPHIETILIFFVLIVENKYPFHNLFL